MWLLDRLFHRRKEIPHGLEISRRFIPRPPVQQADLNAPKRSDTPSEVRASSPTTRPADFCFICRRPFPDASNRFSFACLCGFAGTVHQTCADCKPEGPEVLVVWCPSCGCGGRFKSTYRPTKGTVVPTAEVGRDPALVEHVPVKLPSPPPTGDAYVDSCFDVDFQDVEDARLWHRMPRLRDIPGLASGGKIAEAEEIIDQALRDHPDFEFLYVWRGHVHCSAGRLDAARLAYLDGIEKSRGKVGLCDSLGQWEFDARHLAEAVKWWARACALQLTSRRLTMANPFLRLGRIAANIGLSACAEFLLKCSERIHDVRLDVAGESRIVHVVQDQANGSIRLAIETLCNFYRSVRFTVVMTECGPNKIEVIEVIRKHTDVGLTAAKGLAEAHPPVRLRTGLERDQAEKFVRALKGVGATAEVT